MSALIFNRWDIEEVEVTDPGLKAYVNLSAPLSLHTHGKHSVKQFAKSTISVVERLVNAIMRSGSGKKVGGHLIDFKLGCGKKTKALKAVEGAFEIIEKRTGKNPLQVYVRAIENSAPREETTRVKMGGITRHVAVDIAPQRRVSFALQNISMAALGKAHNTSKSRAEALAEELIAAADGEAGSMSIARKNEVERVAKGAR